MNNRKSLSLRYVMWGQRIWESSVDSVKPWSEWSYQACTVIPNCKNGDRGDNTQNHWYVIIPFLMMTLSIMYVCVHVR